MIFRWTIGPTNANGLDCLMESIKSFQKFYPDNEYYLFFNQIERKVLSKFEKLNLKILDQNNFINNYKLKPKEGYQVHWKLYPLRIDISQHEISIDNDLIIIKKVNEIDLFIQNQNYNLICQGLNHAYGKFNELIPNGLKINTGIFGFKPNFNIEEEMNSIKYWKNYFDEQGLISYVLSKDDYYIIPSTSILILESNFNFAAMQHPLCCGYHFVGLNRLKEHFCWDDYKTLKKEWLKTI